jgi:acylphosphatase
MAEECLRVRVSGRVQHVGFRAWTRRRAQDLGLTGWVRNETDGTVAAELQGTSQAVSRMLELLEKGPPAAKVAEVLSEAAEAGSGRTEFTVLR